MSDSEKLSNTHITELNLGDPRLRRKLVRAGFNNILDVFSLSVREIDDRFDAGTANQIVTLKERFESDPEKLESELLSRGMSEPIRNNCATNGESHLESTLYRLSKTEKSAYGAPRWSGESAEKPPKKPRFYLRRVMPPAQEPFSKQLIELERRAEDEFDRLDDEFDNVMVYQAFGEFSSDLDAIDDAFQSLFSYFRSEPRSALGVIDWNFRNIFLVYVADQARSGFKDNNLWENVFGKIGIFDPNVQAGFKKIFVDQLERRRMPRYSKDEETNYYFYSALIHSGLSADSWKALWAESIVPLAKRIREGSYGYGGEIDARQILREVMNPDSDFAPRKSVLNVLNKAPDATVIPLFDASMRVALQYEETLEAKSEVKLLTSYGLPEVAINALQDYAESSAKAKPRAFGRCRSVSRRSSKLVCMPEAKLRLNLDEGAVNLIWNAQQFAEGFKSCRMDYYLDGRQIDSRFIEARVGKSVLPSVEIPVKPQARYKIEIKLMEFSGKEEDWVERGSLEQTFTRSKPGCYEFIRDRSGTYRLRGRNERINRPRRVAYVVKKHYGIKPVAGMESICEYEATEGWDGTRILVFDIDPGAYGFVVDYETNEEIAVLQEQFRIRLDRRRVIGETLGGLDLYGYVPSGLGTNGGLPSAIIEASGQADDVLNDLDVICLCDGLRVSVPRHVIWDSSLSDDSCEVALVPSESSLFDYHIQCCEIAVKQKSDNGRVVFRYRFAVVPIQGFHLDSVHFDYGIAMADYAFQSVSSISIEDSQGADHPVSAYSDFYAKALLEDEFLYFRINSLALGKSSMVKLALAAVKIEVPRSLVSLSKERPICLGDALELGRSEGNVKITSLGWRHNRKILVMRGGTGFLVKELKGPGEQCFNIFSKLDDLVQEGNSAPKYPKLCATIYYGDKISNGKAALAWADVCILRFQQGLGFMEWDIVVRAGGEHYLVFDSPFTFDARIDFKRKKSGFVIGSLNIKQGEFEATIPSEVVRKLDIHKELRMVVSPVSWCGDAFDEYATELDLTR